MGISSTMTDDNDNLLLGGGFFGGVSLSLQHAAFVY